MPQLKVGDRIVGGFAGVIAVVAITILAVIVQTSAARERTLQVDDLRAPAAFASHRLYAEVVGSANALRGFIITRDPAMRRDWEERWREIDRQSALLDALQGRFTDPTMQQTWRRLRQVLPRFRIAQARAIEASAAASPEAAAETLRRDVLPLFEQTERLIAAAEQEGGLMDGQARLMSADLSMAAHAVAWANSSLLFGGGLMLTVAVLLAGITTRAIRNPLGDLSRALQAMAGGRFDVPIPGAERADEIGAVAKAAAVFRENGLERDRLAQEAARIKAELDRIYDSAPVGLALMDQDLRYLRVNAALATMNGISADAHIGRTFHELVPEVASEVAPELLQVIASGEPRFDLEVTGRTAAQPDAARTWVLNVAPLRQPGGGNTLLLSVLEITCRKRAEAHAKLLMNELNHRVKNTLATVQSVAAQTLRTKVGLQEFKHAFEARLVALSATHDVLTAENWEGVWLRVLLAKELAPYASKEHVRIQGEPVRLNARAALDLGLVVHELATNAAKYGALSAEGGRVTVEWTAGSGELRLSWTESGGPPVQAPQHRGFGSRLIERSLKDLGGGAGLEYAPEGLRCRMSIPLDAIAPADRRPWAAQLVEERAEPGSAIHLWRDADGRGVV